MDQNISLYRIFYVVAKQGNISHAAKDLYISQPAISKAIAKLEENLNVTLFRRSSRGVQLTQEGQVLYEHAAIAFEQLHMAQQHIEKIKELGIGQIRIGVSTTLCKFLLLPYLKSFIAEYPHIKIIIECHSTFHTLKLLEENKLDIGLIGEPDSLKDVTFYPIATITDCFITTNSYLDNLILREKDDSVHTIFNTANIMLLDEKNITRHYVDRYFQAHHIELNQILEISNMDLLIEFAKIGLGIACVIKEFVKEELENKSLIELPLDVPMKSRQVGFAISSKLSPTTSTQKFIDFFKKNDTIEYLG